MATPKKLLQDISAGKFKPLYYFYGTEDYRIAEAVKFISHKFLPDMQFTTNFRKFDGKKTKTGDLITEFATIPMLGEKQVFVVTEFQSFKPKEIQKILSLLKPPDPNRIIILTSPSVRAPRKGSAFLKTMANEAETVLFSRLTKDESAVQIKSKIQKAGLTIHSEAFTLLIELLAGNRGAIESELEKIINYKESGEQVSVEDVKKLTNGFEVFSVFELAEYVVEGKTSKVLQMLRTLLAEGSNPVMLATLMQQHFTTLYLVKNGKAPIGNRSFLIPRFRPQAAKYSDEQLEQIIIQIAEADAQLRQSGMPSEMTLEVLAMSLTGQSSRSGNYNRR